MKRMIGGSVLVAFVLLLSTTSVFAQEPVYYVKLGHVGCEDGSYKCPYNTYWEATQAGDREICEGRTYEVHECEEGDQAPEDCEFLEIRPGKKPIPGAGLPIAPSLLILLIALGGTFLLVLALRLRGKRAR